MKEELRIDIVGLAGACSYALDCIEAELVKIKNKHGKRVAYISVCMAEYLAIQGDALQDLAMCALLHDNALTQYITEELEVSGRLVSELTLPPTLVRIHRAPKYRIISSVVFTFSPLLFIDVFMPMELRNRLAGTALNVPLISSTTS